MPNASQSNSSRVAWAIFAPLAITAFWLYFSSDASRLQAWIYVLIPDELLRNWMGAGLAQFGVVDRLPVLGWAGLWLLASWGAGQWMLGRIFQSKSTMLPGERPVFEAVIGLSATSLLTLLFGLAGWLWQWLFITIASCLSVYAVLGAWKRLQPKETPADRRRLLALVLLAPLLMLYLLSAWMPPFEFDVMAYHLQTPKEWGQQGRIAFTPHNIYANMPLGAEMHPLATITLAGAKDRWFEGAIAGKLVMMSFVPLTALGLWLAGRRWLSELAGIFAAALYLTTPWVFRNGTIGHNEMVIGAYAFFAWYAVMAWTRTDAKSMDPWLGLAGWLCGAAAACKYTAVVFVAAPLWLVALAWGWRPNWRAAAIMAVAGLAAGGAWYAKNLAQTGNPVYPLAYGVFGGRGWDASKAERWSAAHYAHGHSVAQLTEKVASVGWRNVGQSALLPALMLLAATPWGWPDDRPRRDLRRWLLLLLVFTFTLWWAVTHRLDRFLLPAIPWAALLAGGALAQLAGGLRWMRVGAWATVGCLAWIATMQAATHGDSHYLASLDSMRVATYRVHPVHLEANTTDLIPAGKRLLVVADAQVFNLETPILYSSCFDDCPLETLVRDKSPAERRNALKAAGVSHVFVHWSELERYREPGNYGFSPYITRSLFDELVAQGILEELVYPLVEDQPIIEGLYRVTPSAD